MYYIQGEKRRSNANAKPETEPHSIPHHANHILYRCWTHTLPRSRNTTNIQFWYLISHHIITHICATLAPCSKLKMGDPIQLNEIIIRSALFNCQFNCFALQLFHWTGRQNSSQRIHLVATPFPMSVRFVSSGVTTLYVGKRLPFHV